MNFTPAQSKILDMVRAKGAVRLGQQTSETAETIHAPAAIALAKRGLLVLFERGALGSKRHFARLPTPPGQVPDEATPTERAEAEKALAPSEDINKLPEAPTKAKKKKTIDEVVEDMPKPIRDAFEPSSAEGAPTEPAPPPSAPIGEAFPPEGWDVARWDQKMIEGYLDGLELAIRQKRCSLRFALAQVWLTASQRTQLNIPEAPESAAASGPRGGVGGGAEAQEAATLELPALAGDVIDKFVEVLTDVDGASTRENASSVWEGATVRARRGAGRKDDVAIVTWPDGAQASADPAGKIRYNQPPNRAARSTIRRDARLQVIRDVVACVIGSAEIVHAG